MFGGLLGKNPLTRMARERRTPMLTPHPSHPGSMVAFVALPAFLILLTLVSVPLRIFPVGANRVPAVDDAKGSDALARGGAAESPPNGPCEPSSLVLEAARRAAGPDYRHEAAPQMDVEGNTCVVLLWRLPKRPGGYRIVRVDASGRVMSVRPGL